MSQQAEIEWREGQVPVSTRFDDPYFSLENGLDECRHVFLGGNDLPTRFRDGFRIAELGFGTGLNFLASLAEFRRGQIPGTLHFTSFEAYPMSLDEMTAALSRFPELPSDVFHTDSNGPFLTPKIIGPDFSLQVIHGDARETLPRWEGYADAWFLDGFSPAKNPEMWEASLMAQVAAHTATGGTVSTYTAAGFVRRGLESAGFEVTRRPGYGRKRHMTVARKP